MNCRCEQCLPDNPGSTYTNAYRHEMECKYLADMPSDEMRQKYLEALEKKRGEAAAGRLRKDAWTLIKGRNGAGTPRLPD